MLWRLALVALIAVPAFAEDKRPATKDEVTELRASVKELREQVADLRMRLDALIDAVNGGPAPAATAPAPNAVDEIALGLKRHYPVVGMTLEQTENALVGLKYRTTSTTADSEVTEWGIPSGNADEFTRLVYTIIFHDSKVYRIRYHDKPPGNTTGIPQRRVR